VLHQVDGYVDGLASASFGGGACVAQRRQYVYCSLYRHGVVVFL
jgi:hypothetical protein